MQWIVRQWVRSCEMWLKDWTVMKTDAPKRISDAKCVVWSLNYWRHLTRANQKRGGVWAVIKMSHLKQTRCNRCVFDKNDGDWPMQTRCWSGLSRNENVAPNAKPDAKVCFDENDDTTPMAQPGACVNDGEIAWWRNGLVLAPAEIDADGISISCACAHRRTRIVPRKYWRRLAAA